MADDLRRNLMAAAYESLTFPCVDVTTQAGHDRALRQGMLTPGADIQTTGRKPRAVRLRIGLFNSFRGWPDDLFPDRYRELVTLFEDRPLGYLQHPLYGRMRVHVDDWEETVDAKVRNGIWVAASFTEAGNPAEIYGPDTAGTLNAPQDAVQDRAREADELAAALPVAGQPAPILSVVEGALAFLESGRRGYLEATAAIDRVAFAVADRLALPAVAGIEAHAYRVALEAVRASAYAYRASYLGSEQPEQYTVPATMSLSRIAALVYGEPGKAHLLRLANSVPDPVQVPAGTVLTVLRSL